MSPMSLLRRLTALLTTSMLLGLVLLALLVSVVRLTPPLTGEYRDAIAGMLGHANVTTTTVYAKIVDRIAENPARYLEEMMGSI